MNGGWRLGKIRPSGEATGNTPREVLVVPLTTAYANITRWERSRVSRRENVMMHKQYGHRSLRLDDVDPETCTSWSGWPRGPGARLLLLRIGRGTVQTRRDRGGNGHAAGFDGTDLESTYMSALSS